jgi:hypothetical protein
MNRKTAIFLCLIAVCGAGLYFILQMKAAPSGQYARHLPPDAVGTVSLTHLNTITDTFAASALGRFLAKDTVHAILQDLRAGENEIAAYDRFHDGIAEVMTNPAFRTVFGDDATVALLPPDRGQLVRSPVETLRQSLVVIARTSAAGALDLFSRLLTGSKVSRETVDGLELTKLTLERNQVIYGYSDDKTVFLAYAPAAIKACVNAGKAGNTLEKTALFQQARAFWQPYPDEKTYSRVFLNAPVVAELLSISGNPEVKQSSEWLQGVDSMVSLSYATDQGLESRARSTYRYDRLHPLVKSAVDAAAPSNRSLSLLKEQSLAYNWSSSLRPEIFLQTFAGREQDKEEANRAVREHLGVSLDELGQAFGPQYGGVLDDIVRTGLFPVPKMTLFVEVRDRRIAETVLTALRRKIAETGMLSEETEEAAGQVIYSWPLLTSEGAQPSVVLTDSMLYLAGGIQPLKDILAGTAAPDALAAPVAEKMGAELAQRVAKANFGSLVVYPERMSRQTADMIDWLAGILATTKNISIARLNREVAQLMQSTELLAATTHLTKEQADWTLTLRKVREQPAGKTTK